MSLEFILVTSLHSTLGSCTVPCLPMIKYVAALAVPSPSELRPEFYTLLLDSVVFSGLPTMQGLRRLLASALLVVTVTAASLPLKDSFTIHQSLTRRARPKGTDGLARAYARYRAPVSEALEQAVLAQQGTVSAVPTPFDVEYVIPITIGGQQFKIDLDTGSSDLLVHAASLSRYLCH